MTDVSFFMGRLTFPFFGCFFTVCQKTFAQGYDLMNSACRHITGLPPGVQLCMHLDSFMHKIKCLKMANGTHDKQNTANQTCSFQPSSPEKRVILALQFKQDFLLEFMVVIQLGPTDGVL